MLRNNASIVVAFHKVLKAARKNSEVILLDMFDASANQAMQEYNDALSDGEVDPNYRRHVDRLAEKFNSNSMSGKTGQPLMPNERQLMTADRLLTRLLEESNQ